MPKAGSTAHRKWLEQVAKQADREALQRARQRVKQARADRRSALARARQACQRARQRVKTWAEHERDKVRRKVELMRAQLRERIASEREKARTCCGPNREQVRAQALERIAHAQGELHELRGRRATERLWSRKGGPGLTKTERRHESDSQVEAELSPDELLVWRKVKKSMKATAHRSRFESFTHWMHDHPADVASILEAEAEKDLERLLKDEERQRREVAEFEYSIAHPRHLHERVSRVAFDEVPF